MTDRRRRPIVVAVGALLTVGALATSFPFVWMVTSSLKPPSEALAVPPTLLPVTLCPALTGTVATVPVIGA